LLIAPSIRSGVKRVSSTPDWLQGGLHESLAVVLVVDREVAFEVDAVGVLAK